MTFNPTVPNAGQSPGLFPPQNNTNFAVLKTIIDRDHIFNNTPGVNDNTGTHRQVTLTVRGAPGSLRTSTNGILYTILDTNSKAQLHWYNGSTDVAITPPIDLYPIRVVGSAVVANNAFQTIYVDPLFSYEGSAFVGVQGGTIFLNVTPVHWSGGSNSIEEINHGAAGDTRVPISFSGNNLRVQNLTGSSQTLVWSLIVNKTS